MVTVEQYSQDFGARPEGLRGELVKIIAGVHTDGPIPNVVTSINVEEIFEWRRAVLCEPIEAWDASAQGRGRHKSNLNRRLNSWRQVMRMASLSRGLNSWSSHEWQVCGPRPYISNTSPVYHWDITSTYVTSISAGDILVMYR